MDRITDLTLSTVLYREPSDCPSHTDSSFQGDNLFLTKAPLIALGEIEVGCDRLSSRIFAAAVQIDSALMMRRAGGHCVLLSYLQCLLKTGRESLIGV